MKLLLVFAIVAWSHAAKLDRTYLPPPGAATAGGSPGSLTAPSGFQSGQGPFGQTTSQGSPAPAFGRQNAAQGSVAPSHQGQIGSAGQFGGQSPSDFGTQRAQGSLPFGSQAPSNSHLGQNGNVENNFDQNTGPSNQDISGTQFGQAFSQPERAQAGQDRAAEILRYENENDGEKFAYSFETSNGIAAEENGIATNGVQAQGAFSYTGDDGQLYSITYTADENGYQPHGDHLPTPPPIPEAILKSIEENAKAAAAGTQEGAYQEDFDQYDSNGPQQFSQSEQNYNTPQQGGRQTYDDSNGQSSFGSSNPAQASRPTQGPSRTQFNAPSSQSNQYNSPSSSSNQYNAPTSSSNQYNAPTSSSKQYNAPGSSSNQYSTPGTSSNQYNAPGSSSNQYNAPTSPTKQYNAPGTSSNQYNAPTSPTKQYNAPGTSSNQYNAPTSPTKQYNVPASPSNQYNAPTSPTKQYNAPTSPTKQYNAPASPSNQYNAPTPPTKQYNAQASPSNQYNAPTSPTKQYSASTSSSNQYNAPISSSNEYSAPTSTSKQYSSSTSSFNKYNAPTSSTFGQQDALSSNRYSSPVDQKDAGSRVSTQQRPSTQFDVNTGYQYSHPGVSSQSSQSNGFSSRVPQQRFPAQEQSYRPGQVTRPNQVQRPSFGSNNQNSQYTAPSSSQTATFQSSQQPTLGRPSTGSRSQYNTPNIQQTSRPGPQQSSVRSGATGERKQSAGFRMPENYPEATFNASKGDSTPRGFAPPSSAATRNQFSGPRQPPSFSPEEGYKY